MKPASRRNQSALKGAIASLVHGSAIEHAVPHLRDLKMETDMQTLSFRQLGTIGATIVLALAVLSIPYAVQGQRFANLPGATSPMAEALATVVPSAANAGLIDPAVDQAFGFLVFDWDPRAQGGVPGFDRWIPTARAQVE